MSYSNACLGETRDPARVLQPYRVSLGISLDRMLILENAWSTIAGAR